MFQCLTLSLSLKSVIDFSAPARPDISNPSGWLVKSYRNLVDKSGPLIEFGKVVIDYFRLMSVSCECRCHLLS